MSAPVQTIPAQLLRDGDVIQRQDGSRGLVRWARTGYSRVSKTMTTGVFFDGGGSRMFAYLEPVVVIERSARPA